MLLLSDMKNIKEMLKKEPTMLQTTKLEVDDYQEVVELWKLFRDENKLLIDDYWVKQFMEFHKTETNHILLYYSKNMNECLLMCRTNNRYFNIKIPDSDLGKFDKNFIATFI